MPMSWRRRSRRPQPHSRPWLIAAILIAVSLPMTPAIAKHVKHPRHYTPRALRQLFQAVLKRRMTLRGLLKRIDRRAARRNPVAAFTRENIDEKHPALSTPWDLPKKEYPFRATVRREIRVFGTLAELRLVAPLAALDPQEGSKLVNNRNATLVLMLTAKDRAHPLPWRAIQRLFAHLGLSVYAGGELGPCDSAKLWCFRRRYAFLPRRGQRKGTLLLEMGRRGSQAGGIKLIAQRQ